MKKSLFIVSILSVVFLACSKENTNKAGEQKPPQVIEIGNHEFIIEADVYRDFSDTLSSDSLQSAVRLIDRNGNVLEGLFLLSGQKLIQGTNSWQTPFDSMLNKNHLTFLEGVSYGGPLWEIGSKVEVICTFQDAETKTLYDILAPVVTVYEK